MAGQRQPLIQADVGSESLEAIEVAVKRVRRMKACMTCTTMITIFIAGAVFHKQVESFLDAFIAACSKLGPVAVAAVFLATAATNLLMLPCFPLMVSAGLIFPKMYGFVAGPAIGVASVFGGMWVGSVVAFHLGRSFFKRWAEDELHSMEWMQVVNKMVEVHGWWMVLLARMSPILPAEVFNYACSLTHLTLCEYAAGCTGSLIPVAVWVYSTASASSFVASSQEADAEARRRNLILLVVNVFVLATLSIALFCAVRKYRVQATAASKEFAIARGLSSTEERTICRQVSAQDFTIRSLSRESTQLSSDVEAH